MQPITEILKVLKTKFSDAYVLASSGDVVVETAGRKRGSRASATILCEAEARAQAREITGDITEEERGALAGLVLFFDFQRQLGEALEEQAILAEIEAEIALEEAVAATVVVPTVDEAAAQTADEAIEELEALAAEHAAEVEAAAEAKFNKHLAEDPQMMTATEVGDNLVSLKALSFGALNHFEGQGVKTVPELIERLSDTWSAADPPLWICHACQALFTYSGGDITWMERASAARELVMANEESYRQAKRALDPGQFHGADGAEKAHVKAKATMRKLSPVARFVAEGIKYARKLDKGTADEVTALKADILIRWGNGAERVVFPTLKVSWA